MNKKLWKAARENDASACREVLNYHMHGDICAQVNSKSENDYTALHIAASEGNTDVCKLLIEFSDEIDLNAVTTSQQSALHIAAEKGFLDVVQLLVNAGCVVNMQDCYGRTALHYAAARGFGDLVSWLLGKDPETDIHDREGRTAYQCAQDQLTAELFEMYFTERNIPFRRRKIPHVSSADALVPQQDQIDRLLVKAQAAHSPVAMEVFVGLAQHPVYDIMRTSKSKAGIESYPHAEYEDFIPKYQLGKGSFGEVYLVEKRDTRVEYAMKVLSKETIMGQNLVKYAVAERNVLSYIKHPFIVGLNYAFQTPEKLVLIMDYCPGGDLGKILRKEKR